MMITLHLLMVGVVATLLMPYSTPIGKSFYVRKIL